MKLVCPECGNDNCHELMVNEQPWAECRHCQWAAERKTFEVVPWDQCPPPVTFENPRNQFYAQPIREGIKVWREEYIEPDADEWSGHYIMTFTNIPYYCCDDLGYTWGAMGSGSTKFSMNCLEAVLRAIRYSGPRVEGSDIRQSYRGSCFAVANQLKYDFQRVFAANMNRDGAEVPFDLVASWLQVAMTELRYGR